jgi:hypothetical protein
MTSASESSSRPSADDVWRQRAIRPSRTSKANAAGAKAAEWTEVAIAKRQGALAGHIRSLGRMLCQVPVDDKLPYSWGAHAGHGVKLAPEHRIRRNVFTTDRCRLSPHYLEEPQPLESFVLWVSERRDFATKRVRHEPRFTPQGIANPLADAGCLKVLRGNWKSFQGCD